MTKNLIETVLISNKDYKDLLQERDELKQENKDLKKQIESDKGLITVGGKQQYKYLQEIDKLQQENKELKETVKDLNQSIQNCNIQRTKMYKALEEIRTLCFKDVGDYLNAKVVWLIDEVLNEVDR